MKIKAGRNHLFFRRLTAAAVLAMAFSLPAFAQQKKVKVFAFYPSFDLTPAITNNQMDGITHVVFFSVRMPTDGRLTEAYVSSQTNTQKLVDVVNRGNSRGVKTLLAIGGWELSAEFPAVAADPSRRRAFAQTAADLCKNNGLAGIDIDWEFPTGHQANLSLLMDEILLTFRPANLLVTMSVNGERPDYYGSAALNKADYVLIMAYDMGSPHSTYNHAVSAVTAYKGQVTQAAKLVLGVPFYGKSGGATRTYAELLQMNPSMSPATNDYAGYNFNGPDLIRQKSAYIVDQGGGGTMIWQISQDAVNTANPKGVLLTAMNAGFTSRNAVLDKAPVSIHPLRSRNAAGTLTWENGGFRLPGISASSRGSYRLTLLAADGQTLASALSRSSGDGLRWSIDQSHPQPFFYRVDGVSGTISTGPVEGR